MQQTKKMSFIHTGACCGEGAGPDMARLTTLCYITTETSCLMLYRNAKEHDENLGKWIGCGGKFKDGESPDECMLREVKEETGLTLTSYSFKGVITFISNCYEHEYMFLYEGTEYEGTVREDCPEGLLRWIPREQVMDLPLWEGDRCFLRELLDGKDRIRWKLTYEGDDLVSAESYT